MRFRVMIKREINVRLRTYFNCLIRRSQISPLSQKMLYNIMANVISLKLEEHIAVSKISTYSSISIFLWDIGASTENIQF